MPAVAGSEQKFPPLLKMDPYHGKCPGKSTSGDRDFLAQHGYVAAYFHVRGSGLSEGSFQPREYSEQELQDAIFLIDWLSRQPWSTGRVGMFGESWSAFNSLQVAIRRPPALKAIVPFVGTENIYHEGERFTDGIFRFDSWSAAADSRLIIAPESKDPMLEDMLVNRFDQPPWTLIYTPESRDGEFWRRDIRVDVNPDGLQVPTMMIGGWYDGYRTSILRTMVHVRAPNRAIVGPWDHGAGYPGPEADLHREVLRWWDYWLKDKQTGVLEDPQLVAYMRRPYLPIARPGAIPGEWRAVHKWPPADLEERRLYLGADRGLSARPSQLDSHLLRYIPSGGAEVGVWWGEPMTDQRPADAYSLVYDSEPLQDELQMLGGPKASLRASATASHANWFVRISDVAPDGTVAMVTAGALNGTHRNSSVNPKPMVPGQIYDLDVPLQFTSWIFEPGHRIRIAISNALFPMTWPTPRLMTTRLEVGTEAGSSIVLPLVRPQSAESAEAAARLVGSMNVSPEEIVQATPADPPAPWPGPAVVTRDNLALTTHVTYTEGASSVEYHVADEHPEAAWVTGTMVANRTFNGHQFEWRGLTKIWSDLDAFHITHDRKLLRDGEVVRERSWEKTIPRDFQ